MSKLTDIVIAAPVELPTAEHDKSMDRHYLPLMNGWEIQTKGKGSTFRICKVNGEDDYERWQVTDERLHAPLQRLSEDCRAALAQRAASVAPTYRNDPNVQGMADCMDMVRQELIEAGVIGAEIAPLFIANAVVAHITQRAGIAAKPYGWLTGDSSSHREGTLQDVTSCYEWAKAICDAHNTYARGEPDCDPDHVDRVPMPLYASTQIAQPKPPADAAPVDMHQVLVEKTDAVNYCRILSLLDMEEEGDPVAEIESMLAQPAAVQQGSERDAALPDVVALAWKWHREAVDTGFACSEPAQELFELLGWPDAPDAAMSAPQGKPPTPPAAADSLETSELDALPYDGKDRT